jgi:hypothetical protein
MIALGGVAGLLTSSTAPWLLSAVTQAAAAILALGVGSLSVATIFLFRAGDYHRYAATPFRQRLQRLGRALALAGVCALLALMVGSVGLLILVIASPILLTILCVMAAVLLVLSALGALATAYLLWQTVQDVSSDGAGA